MRRNVIILILFSLMFGFLSHGRVYGQTSYDKYIWEEQVINNIDPTKSAPYKQKLTDEIQKIVSVGHLEPALFGRGIMGDYILWGSPTEEIFFLSSAIPYISEPLKSNLINFLKQEMSIHKVWQVAFTPQSSGVFSLTQNPRREYFQAQSGYSHNIWPPVNIPLESLATLYAYAKNTNDWQFIRDNWNSIQSFYTSTVTNGGTDTYCNQTTGTTSYIKRYGQISGLIGYLRLLDGVQKAYPTQTFTNSKQAAINTVSSAFSAGADFETYYQISKKCFETGSAHDWIFPPFHFLRHSGVAGVLMTEEVGRFLSDTPIAKSRIDYYIVPIINRIPGWYIWRGDYPFVGYGDIGSTYPPDPIFGGGYSENSYFPPDFGWTIFKLKAHVYKEKGDILAKYVDVPTVMRGDLYYIDKLVTTVEGYGTECWENITTSQVECPNTIPTNTPTSQASPTPTPKPGDCEPDGGDSDIDIFDYNRIVSNFGSSTNLSCDFVNLGSIDIFDYNVVVSNFGT